MNLLSTFLISMTLSILNDGSESKTKDLEAFRVVEKRTLFNGIYYSYEIKNVGETSIPANSYQVFFKVDGKVVSFDKGTSEIQPGQVISYESQKVFYKKKKDGIDYSLEIKFKDADLDNNSLEGQSRF
jgi:archaellum component FlaG (FlaF/FlaG flagellin family)